MGRLIDDIIRRVDILCIQKTKWVSDETKVIELLGYKLWHMDRDRNRNGYM